MKKIAEYQTARQIPYDLAVVSTVLENMTPTQRREWFVKMKMSERTKSFEDIATRHHFTRARLSDAVNGKSPWSPRVIKALQDDLAVDLTPFLTEKEAARYCAKFGARKAK